MYEHEGSMFTPPPAGRQVFRGSVWGPASSYWVFLAGWLVIVAGVGRSSPPAGAVIGLAGAVVIAAVAWFAVGTSIAVDATTLTVTRRLRQAWTIPTSDLLQVTEVIPVRPRAPSMAGWTFVAVDPDNAGVEGSAAGQDGPSRRRASVELAMFSPLDRRRLRALFAEVLVDADAGMHRR